MIPARWRERLRAALLKPLPTTPLDPERVFGPQPTALYLHVPFCAHKCAYCSFNTFRRPPTRMRDYVTAVEREIASHATRPELGAVEVSSIYVGGGTPTHLPADDMARLLDALTCSFRLRPGVQVTLEANPDSLGPEKLERYRSHGVNRISLGVQTFDPEQLRLLGRGHGVAEIYDALRRLGEVGLSEVSLDLMFGLPGQSLAGFADDLAKAIDTGVPHVSLFPLSHRPGTALSRRRARRRPLWRMYRHALDTLAAAGFRQYTTEDFTRGAPCAYQLDLWQPPPKDCLGIGPGALSSWRGTNWHNLGDLDAYIAACSAERAPIAGGGRPSVHQQMHDHIHLAVRTLRLDRAQFEARFGVPAEHVLGPLPAITRALGLTRRDERGDLELTARGRYLASRVWSEFILAKLSEAAESGA